MAVEYVSKVAQAMRKHMGPGRKNIRNKDISRYCKQIVGKNFVSPAEIEAIRDQYQNL